MNNTNGTTVVEPALTQERRREIVDLYGDYLRAKSHRNIEVQKNVMAKFFAIFNALKTEDQRNEALRLFT